MTSSTGRHGERGKTTRALAAVGGLAAILTIGGLSGVGDAPAPLAEAQQMAEHFQAVRVDVFIGAAVGFVGAALLTCFGLTLALRLALAGERGAALVVGAGLTAVLGYLLAIHVVYATLSYAVATTSADVTKGMFVATKLRCARLRAWRRDAARRCHDRLWPFFQRADSSRRTFNNRSSPDILVAWLLTTSIVSAVGRRHHGPDEPA